MIKKSIATKPATDATAASGVSDASDGFHLMNYAATFLLDRLDEYSPEDTDSIREYYGHVIPAIARIRVLTDRFENEVANTRTPDSSESPPPGIFADPISPDKQRVEALEKALEEITAACEKDCTSDSTETGDVFPDEESVGGGEDGDMALTFGMIRRARAALNGRTGV